MKNNENFLSFIEMIVEWDLIIQKYLNRIKNNEIYVSYKI